MLVKYLTKTRNRIKPLMHTHGQQNQTHDFDSTAAQVLFKKRRIHEAIYLLMRVYEMNPIMPVN
jgi:hypothetical protein